MRNKRFFLIFICMIFILIGTVIIIEWKHIPGYLNKIEHSLKIGATGSPSKTKMPATRSTFMAPDVATDTKSVIDGIENGDLWGYKFNDKIDWTLPGVTNPTIKYEYHGMIWLEVLVADWNITHDERYTKKAISIVMDWISTFKEMEDGQPDMTWNDDATARRCYAICLMVDSWKDKLTAEQLGEIQSSLKYQATLLASPDFYTWRQNHGIFQDRALLTYTKNKNIQ